MDFYVERKPFFYCEIIKTREDEVPHSLLIKTIRKTKMSVFS